MSNGSYVNRNTIDSFLAENMNRKMSEITEEDYKVGKQQIDELMKSIGDVPLVDILWKKRKKSNLIKWLMSQANLSMDDLAKYFGCKRPYLSNKFNRDSFSFEDIIIAAYAANYRLALWSKDKKDNDTEKIRIIEPEAFFDNEPDIWDRIAHLKNQSLSDKRAEYEAKKAELERMKQEYGFDD